MAEIHWDGKYKDGKRVAPVRLTLPFQDIETVNESSADRKRTLDLFASGRPTEWRNRLIWGDKKYVLPSLLPEFAGKVNLIYIDPPFDTGADFSFTTMIPGGDDELTKQPSILEQKAYRDTWGHGLDSYVKWFYDTASILRDLLADTGSLFVHLDWHVGHYIKVVLDEIFGLGAFNGGGTDQVAGFRNEIAWCYSGGGIPRNEMPRKHDTIFWYTKGPTWTFNAQYRPYSAGTVERGRTAIKGPDAKLRAEGTPVNDWWPDVKKITSPTDPEKLYYATQKSEELLSRIIKIGSNEGDLVLDCFCGSGTTAAAAEKLGRRWIAADLGRFAIHTTRKRLLDLAGIKPFVVQNLGKYERQAWMKAEFEPPEDRAAAEGAYRRFILDLFKAEPISGNAWLHGIKGGRLVHIGAVDAPITLADVKSIASEVWKMGGRTDAPGATAAAEILGWEFAFELNETAKQLAAEARVDVKFRRIPREVLEKAAIDQGDVGAKDFFELRALSAKVSKARRVITVELTDFIIPPEDLPDDVRRAVKNWSQWIDYWAVDWDFKDDTFHNEWQSFRTREDPKLSLRAEYEYPKPGTYGVVIKVIDILGNDTTKSITVEVK